MKREFEVERYWKWDAGGRFLGVFRVKKGVFQRFSNGVWQASDYLDRASQDPDFEEVSRNDALRLLLNLDFCLGRDPQAWPNDRLINFPDLFDPFHDFSEIQRANEIAKTDINEASRIIRAIDSEIYKRWFIDVAQNVGTWRFKHLGKSKKGTDGKWVKRVNPPRRLILDLFQNNAYQCQYCGIPIVGDRKHFVDLAKRVNVPELVNGKSNEERHGLYLMFRGSHDHVKPLALGGTNEIKNLLTACWPCQFGKYHYSLDELAVIRR
jgi:hypothetical protein